MEAPQEIVIRLTINAPPEKVFDAFTSKKGWCKWCCERAESEAYIGGKFHIYTEGYNAYGEYLEYEQDRALKFTWDGDGEPNTLIAIIIGQQDAFSLLTFKVVGLCSTEEWAGIADFLQRTWGRVLGNLKSVLEEESST